MRRFKELTERGQKVDFRNAAPRDFATGQTGFRTGIFALEAGGRRSGGGYFSLGDRRGRGKD